jgi:parallel beta-helix repeat protein
VYNPKGTAVWNNSVTRSDGFDGIGLWSSSFNTVINNNVSGFTVDSTYGLAQIYLDPSATNDLVVCAECSDNVLNQGTNKTIIGCQQSAAAAEGATSAARPNLLRKKPPLR